MGNSRNEFVKYPRTPHLFGSKGTDDDKHLSEAESQRFISDESLIVEEKIDGTNVGIHFTSDGTMVLQCRGTSSRKACTRNTTCSSSGQQ
jgi:hypothetical protein